MQNKLVLFFICAMASFAFAPNNLPKENAISSTLTTSKLNAEKPAPKISMEEKINELYDDFSMNNANMPALVPFQYGMQGYFQLMENKKIKNNILTIVDFSLPSSQKRMWILDMASHKVLVHTFVAHGQKTGLKLAEKFSNKNESHQSSLGFYLTAETYVGKHGLSMRMDGLEKGFNSNARDRYIVVHGADYATADFVKRTGRLGRSWGCPAVPEKLSKKIIQTIKGKSCFFIYYPSEKYLHNSRFLSA